MTMTLDPTRIDWTATGALAAFIISVASFANSFYVGWRDRARLRITSYYDDEARTIRVTMVNAGRRPIVLKMIGFNAGGDRWSGTYLDSQKGGIRLQEHQDYTHNLTREDTVALGFEGREDYYAESFWVEDTLGNRYPIPKSREHIKTMNEKDEERQ